MTQSMSSAVVIAAHEASYAEPIWFSAGEAIEVEREDLEYPNWYWCRSTNGKEGWVHASFLAETSGATVGAQDYCAAELTVQPGCKVDVVQRIDGWLLVRLEDGTAQGWIPETCVA